MRTLEEIVEDAKPKATFLNPAQYEVFVAKQCDSCLVDTDKCPLIDAAFQGFWPNEFALGKTARFRCLARQRIPSA